MADDMARIGQIHDVLRAVCTTEFMTDFFKPAPSGVPLAPPMYMRCSDACNKINKAVNDQLKARGYTCICASGKWTGTLKLDYLQTVLRDVTKAKTTVEDILEHNWIIIGEADSSFIDSEEALQAWCSKAIVVFDPTFYQFNSAPSTDMKTTWAFDECLEKDEFLTLSPTRTRESLIGQRIRVRVFSESCLDPPPHHAVRFHALQPCDGGLEALQAYGRDGGTACQVHQSRHALQARGCDAVASTHTELVALRQMRHACVGDIGIHNGDSAGPTGA